MRRPIDNAALHRLLEALARRAGDPTTVYLVGGANAVEVGWRSSTIDLRLLVTVEDELYRFPAVDPPSLRRAVDELVARG